MAILETTADWRKDEGYKLCQQVRADIMNRRDWEAQRLESRALYYGDVQRPDIHWEGATDIHLPVVYENIERLIPKLNNAFWNVWPHVIVDRVPSEYDPRESRIQEHFMNWALDYDIPGFYMTTHQWFRNSLLDGVGQVKTYYVTSWRMTCEVRRVKSHKPAPQSSFADPQQDAQTEPKSAMDILDELFGRGNWFPTEDMAANEIRLTIIDQRRPIENVRVVFAGTSQFIDEIDVLVYRPIIVEDNPRVEVVEAENLVLPARARNIQNAKRVTHIHFMTLDEVRHEAHASRFDPWHIAEEDWAILEQATRTNTYEEQINENTALQDLKDSVEGTTEAIKPLDTNPIRFYEIYKKIDLDGDGMPEELVFQVSPDLNKIVHVTYLDTLHPHGRRPFSSIHFNASTDRYYTPGLAAFLAPLNIQANISINQINDRQTLINNPIGFYRPMALPQDTDSIKDLEPGTLVPTPDPGGIVFPNWGTAPLQDMAFVDVPLMFADRIGTSPMFGGNSTPQTPRTARGTMSLLAEGNIKIDVLISMAQKEGFQELMQQLFGLYAVNMSDEKHFWATGRDRVKRPEMISRQLLRGRYEFRFRGNTVNTNPEVQRTLAQIRYQVAATNPLYMNDPVKFRELLRDFLEAHSDGTSVERILPDLPGGGAEPHPPMDQMDEIAAMRVHRIIEPLATDNHLKHMAELDRFRQSPVFEQLDQVTVMLMIQHYAGHQQMAARASQMQRLQQGEPGGNDGGGAGGAEQGIGLSELGI